MIYVGNDSVVDLFQDETCEVLTVFAAQASLILPNALLLDELRDGQPAAVAPSSRSSASATSSAPARRCRRCSARSRRSPATDIIGADHRRDRHRQGAHRPRDPPPLAADRAALRDHQLRRHPREPARERAVRPRQGRLHRRGRAPGTASSRRPTAAPCSSTRSARCRSTCRSKLLRAMQEKVVVRVGDTRTEQVDIRIVAATNRDLEEEIQRGPLPRGPLLPAQRGQPAPAAAARARRRRAGHRHATCWASTPRSTTSRLKGFSPNAAVGDPQVRLARQHPPAREPHQEGDRAVRRQPARPRRPRTLTGDALPPILPLAAGQGGVPARLHQRGARAQQRQPHQDRARPGRRSADDLPPPGKRGAELRRCTGGEHHDADVSIAPVQRASRGA